MSNQDVPVIDLTNSFTLANHDSLCNVVINLDASFTSDDCTITSFGRMNDDSTIIIDDVPQTVSSSPEQSSKPSLKRSTHKCNKKERFRPYHSPKNQSSSSKSKIGNCPICFEELGLKAMASTKCGHVFCLVCLEKSLQFIKVCPACRTTLKGKSAYHPLFL